MSFSYAFKSSLLTTFILFPILFGFVTRSSFVFSSFFVIVRIPGSMLYACSNVYTLCMLLWFLVAAAVIVVASNSCLPILLPTYNLRFGNTLTTVTSHILLNSMQFCVSVKYTVRKNCVYVSNFGSEKV